jgi:hypothetical protein
VTTGTLIIAGLLGGAAGGGFVGTAGAQEQDSLIRCEADFLGFMIGSATDAINAGCEDLAPAYQAGVAAYQQRNATCDAIDRIAHPIKRTSCEAGAKWDGLRAFRSTAKAIRDAPAASAPTATTADSSGSPLTDGVKAVGRLIEEHPAASLGVGLGAATLAFPPTRAATMAVGSGITGVLGKLVNIVKAPFAAVARALS